MNGNMQVCQPCVSAYACELDRKKARVWRVVGRILRNTRWRKIWGMCTHWRWLVTLAWRRGGTSIVACRTRNTTSKHRLSAAYGLFRKVSRHVSRLQTVSAHCANLAFPMDSVSFWTPTQHFPTIRPWCTLESATHLWSLDNMTCEHVSKRQYMCTFWLLGKCEGTYWKEATFCWCRSSVACGLSHQTVEVG